MGVNSPLLTDTTDDVVENFPGIVSVLLVIELGDDGGALTPTLCFRFGTFVQTCNGRVS